MRLGLNRAVMAATVLACTASVHAAELVSQSPNQGFGDNMSFATVADNFSLTSTNNITSLRFWSLQLSTGDYSGNVAWAIHSNSGGTPGAVLFSGVQAVGAASTGQSALGGFYSEFLFDIPVSFQLTAGDYWLSLHNGPLTSSGSTDMLWETSGNGDTTSGHFNDLTDQPDLGWLSTGNEHAFSIFGNAVEEPPPPGQVPAPATLALLVGGLLAASAARKSRQGR